MEINENNNLPVSGRWVVDPANEIAARRKTGLTIIAQVRVLKLDGQVVGRASPLNVFNRIFVAKRCLLSVQSGFGVKTKANRGIGPDLLLFLMSPFTWSLRLYR